MEEIGAGGLISKICIYTFQGTGYAIKMHLLAGKGVQNAYHYNRHVMNLMNALMVVMRRLNFAVRSTYFITFSFVQTLKS